jgi:hypothetical protein
VSNEQPIINQGQQAQEPKGDVVKMESLLAEYEIALQDILRENIMLKALLAQKRAEERKGTE